jgi:hypothetical protein
MRTNKTAFIVVGVVKLENVTSQRCQLVESHRDGAKMILKRQLLETTSQLGLAWEEASVQ